MCRLYSQIVIQRSEFFLFVLSNVLLLQRILRAARRRGDTRYLAELSVSSTKATLPQLIPVRGLCLTLFLPHALRIYQLTSPTASSHFHGHWVSWANTCLFRDMCFDHTWELIVKILDIYRKIVSTWRKRKQLLQINYSPEILIFQLQNWTLKNRHQISQTDTDKIT